MRPFCSCNNNFILLPPSLSLRPLTAPSVLLSFIAFLFLLTIHVLPARLPRRICIAFTLHSALLFKQIHGLINYFSRWQLSFVARRHVTSTVCIVCLYNAIFIAIFVPRTTTATNSLHCIVCKLIASLLPWIWISCQTMAAICRLYPFPLLCPLPSGICGTVPSVGQSRKTTANYRFWGRQKLS